MGKVQTGTRRRVHPLPLIEYGSEVGGWVRAYDRPGHFLLSLQPLIQHAHWAQAKSARDKQSQVSLL